MYAIQILSRVIGICFNKLLSIHAELSDRRSRVYGQTGVKTSSDEDQGSTLCCLNRSCWDRYNGNQDLSWIMTSLGFHCFDSNSFMIMTTLSSLAARTVGCPYGNPRHHHRRQNCHNDDSSWFSVNRFIYVSVLIATSYNNTVSDTSRNSNVIIKLKRRRNVVLT